jgi:gliding motility-associated-like protein
MLSKITACAKLCCLLLAAIISGKVEAQLAANFNATPIAGCAPLLVRFTDASSGNPTQWRWDLGNGTTSFLKNPSVTYLNPGKYTVKLIVSDINGADSIVKTDFVNVLEKPTVQFSANDTTGCFPLKVRFTDASISPGSNITSWLWDFGDGNTSTQRNPQHTYTTGGNFNVTLQIRNAAGCIASLNKSPYITINTGAVAKFTQSNPNTCTPPVSVSFTNQSVGTGTLNYFWDFGNGNTSTEINPVQSFNNSGSYTIKLIVNNSGCADTLIKTNAVVLGFVDAAFVSADSVCQGSRVNFLNTSTPAPTSLSWSFGDGTTSMVANPQKVFNLPGIYYVKMTAQFGACTDTFSKTIVAPSKPVVNFRADDTANCKAPFLVQFHNQTPGGTSFLWDFGNGQTSTWQTPNHTYLNPGSYHVKLRVTNANGCTDSLVKRNFIVIRRPLITLRNIPDSNCAPFTKQFAANISSIDAVTSYLWNFGDGNTATTATAINTFSNPGVYPISLIVTTADGCIDSIRSARGIVVTNKPQVDFMATPLVTCAKDAIHFRDSTVPRPNRWLWNFGNGITSAAQHPIYQYKDTGLFTITLVAWNSGCADTLKKADYIRILPPIAKFNLSSSCQSPMQRSFIDQSIGADEWYWDFGDGNTSRLQSPIHNYANPGNYVVALRVVNLQTGCDFTVTRSIQIINTSASFTANDTVVCKRDSITFSTGLSATDIANFEWNFGNGSAAVNSSRPVINFSYAQPGFYTVRLVTTDQLGCKDTLVKNQYIRVNGPTANFGVTTPGNCLNSNVSFSDSSRSDGINAIVNWQWNYGDGTMNNYTAPPFVNQYDAPGTYQVSLTVTDAQGCLDSSKLRFPLIISKPIALFSSLDTLVCPGSIVKFKDSSNGLNLRYEWNFGDGKTDTSASPSHTYIGQGLFNVTLTVTDSYGCKDSSSKSQFVQVVVPQARFSMSDSFSTCPPLIVDFADSSAHALSYNWDFGDNTNSVLQNPSHFYSLAGVLTAKLTIVGPGGCTSTAEKTIQIRGPRGELRYTPQTGCEPLQITFQATIYDRASLIWDFNDGATQVGTDTTTAYTYRFKGNYLPKMILVDEGGCQVPIPGPDSIRVKGVDAGFTFNKKLMCDSGSVQFLDSSIANEPIINHSWNFGDGNTGVGSNPTHLYSSSATVYPSLIVSTVSGCSDTLTSLLRIKIVASPQISINRSANGCTPLTVNFQAQQTIADTSAIRWQWDFANGNTSTQANAGNQQYTTAGLYVVKLLATNSSGCIDTASVAVDAFAIPNVNAGPADTILCLGTPVQFNATGAASYVWSPATNLSCANCPSPATSTSRDLTYTLVGTSAQGCVARDSIAIKVKSKFVFNYSRPDSVCRGKSVRMSASGANIYSWTPTTGLDDASSATPVATPTATTNYRVIGKDNVGCFSDTGFVQVKVNEYPTVEAGDDKTINVGTAIDLIPNISTDVVQVDWQPTGTIFRNFYPGISVKPNQNTSYEVEVKNRSGCAARDRVNVIVVCNGGNVFMPNTFSPNGDGVNDFFYPRGTGLFKIKTLRIFSRWGEQVFERTGFDANNPTYGWDGTVKGKTLSADVYVYVMEVICDNNSIITYNGNVALIK